MIFVIFCNPAFQAIVKKGENPSVTKLAQEQLDHYNFPVMMYVSLPNGTIVHEINANDFMDDTPDGSKK